MCACVCVCILIGNKNFIERNEHRVKMMNTMNMKQKHIVQELKLTDCRKLEIEIQGIKPKI